VSVTKWLVLVLDTFDIVGICISTIGLCAVKCVDVDKFDSVTCLCAAGVAGYLIAKIEMRLPIKKRPVIAAASTVKSGRAGFRGLLCLLL
jgi:hypothetical protein